MEKKIITFTADEQSLRKTGGIPNYASNKVSYIEAQFELGENWQGFDAVRAIWYNKAQTISMVLADGKCIVPYEVLANKGQVMVNLVGSISENDVLTDRLTTYPVVALIVDADAKVDGSNTYPITPSQFEQFVEAVKADAESASESAESASESAESASESAESASASAKSAHDDKIEIEQKIAEVIQQIEDFEQVEVVVNTLPAGSQATSDFTDGVLTLGIPQGAKGDTGNGIASCVLNPDYTLTINFTDGTSYITTSIRGAQGVKGDTGNGISSITKTGSETVDGRVVDTYTTTFTDGETTEFEVTNGKDGEVTMSQLSSLLPTDTASGDIASFSDGTDLFPALSVKAEIEPIQDLHGYDKPWSGGNGKNKFNPTPYAAYLQSDGTYKLTGTQATAIRVNIPASIVGVSCCFSAKFNLTNSGTLNWMRTRAYINGSYINGSQIANGNVGTSIVNFTPVSTDDYIYVECGSGGGNNIIMSELQLEVGSTATDYEPYSNICPISGHTECVTSVSGVNVWDEEWEVGNYSPSGAKVNSTAIRSVNFIPCKPSTDYYLAIGSGSGGRACFYDAGKTFISTERGRNKVISTPSNCYYMTISTAIDYADGDGTKYNHDISINYPSTDHDYHAYDGHTYTTTLGRTVYGGTLDVVSGGLVVDRAMVTLDGTQQVNNPTQQSSGLYTFIIPVNDMVQPFDVSVLASAIKAVDYNHRTYSEPNIFGANANLFFTTDVAETAIALKAWFAQNPLQVVYELATPQTYQLDPTEVDLLLGQNNLWTDCGSVEVTYKADVGLYIDKKLSSNGTRSLSMGLTKSATVEAETETEPSKTEAETEETKTETEEAKAETETK